MDEATRQAYVRVYRTARAGLDSIEAAAAREDPLAEPAEWARSRTAVPQDARGAPVLDVCSTIRSGDHCTHAVAEIWEIGCLDAEHAGPLPFCPCCGDARMRDRTAALVCGQCGGRIVVFRRFSVPDGLGLPLPRMMPDQAVALLKEMTGG
jgi:hypothetical protein